jgi:hypothetical protein
VLAAAVAEESEAVTMVVVINSPSIQDVHLV